MPQKNVQLIQNEDVSCRASSYFGPSPNATLRACVSDPDVSLSNQVCTSYLSGGGGGEGGEHPLTWVFDLGKFILVAKCKVCLQPEKTHGYQYLFTVQFFIIRPIIGAGVNKGYIIGGLNKVLRLRDCHHRIRRQILCQNRCVMETQ